MGAKDERPVNVYLSGTWVILTDLLNKTVITIYKVNFGIGEEFNKQFIEAVMKRIEEDKVALAEVKQQVDGEKKAYQEIITKIESQKFIDELEKRLGMPKGSISKQTREVIKQIDNAKLSKQTIEDTYSKIVNDIKLDKAQSLKNMTLKEYDALRQAKIRAFIKKALIGIGIYSAVKMTGIERSIINTLKFVP